MCNPEANRTSKDVNIFPLARAGPLELTLFMQEQCALTIVSVRNEEQK